MTTPPPDGAGPEGTPVDDLERCTSYLDGTLDAEERAALEAELAGDADLRALLDALQQAERALGTCAPTPLPEGARERLDAVLADPLAAATTHQPPTTDDATTAPASTAPTTAPLSTPPADELSARRRRPVAATLTGVAAGLVLLAGGVIGLSQLSPDGTSEEAMLQADQAEVMPPADEPALSGGAEVASDGLPVVTDEGRTISDGGGGDAGDAAGGAAGDEAADDAADDAGDARSVLDDPQLQALAQRGLSGPDGAQLARDIQGRILGDASDSDMAAEPEADAGAASAPTGDPPPLRTRDGTELDPRVSEDLRRCLRALLDPGQLAIPATIELVTLDGSDAAIFGLLTPDPETDTFSRVEAWTLALDGCQVLRFDQS